MDDMIPHFICPAVIVAEDVAINRLRMNTIDNIYLNQDFKKIKRTMDYYLFKRKFIVLPDTINEIIDQIENEKDLTQIEVESFKEIQKFALSFDFRYENIDSSFEHNEKGFPFVDFSRGRNLMRLLVDDLSYFGKNKNAFYKEIENFQEWYLRTDKSANALSKLCGSYRKTWEKKSDAIWRKIREEGKLV